MKEAMAAFFGSNSVAISCHRKRSKIILVEVLTEVCSLKNIASWTGKKSQWHGLIQCRWRWDCWFACGRHAEKVGNFYSLCLLHVPCNSIKKEIIKQWKKNYWALFWYINELVQSCMEATVLLNVYPVFVSKFDFDCESNIRQHSTVDRKAYYNAIQNVFVV